jgi:hypothetical protein
MNSSGDSPKTYTEADLERILHRWEGAVSECEREGNDSDEAVAELANSRGALLDVLRFALIELRRAK